MQSSTPDSTSRSFVAVSPSNTVAFSTEECRALFVGNGGDVTVPNLAGDAITFENVPDGSVLPVRCRRVNATGTTATGIVALF